MEYKLSVGTGLKRQCLPVAREADKVSARKYILARKDAKGKTLKMENKAMLDFLLHPERGKRLARNGIYYTLKTVLRVMQRYGLWGSQRKEMPDTGNICINTPTC